MRALAAVVLFSCSTSAPIKPDASYDAAVVDVAMTVDAGPRCDPAKPFGAPTLALGINTDFEERDARLTADELAVYFVSDHAGQSDIYVATRATRSDPFGAATLVSVSSSELDGSPTLSADGHILVFDSTRGAGPHRHIFVATRAGKSGPFSPPLFATNVNRGGPSGSIVSMTPYFQYGTQHLWFTTSPPVAGGIYVADYLGEESFEVPQLVLAADNGFYTGHPVPSRDGKTLMFASDRYDPDNLGGLDIFMGVRQPDDSFVITNVRALNSDAADMPTWISPDGCVLYMTSLRTGNGDVYVSVRDL